MDKFFIFSFPRSGLHLFSRILGLNLYVNFDAMSNEGHVINKIQNYQHKETLFTHQTLSMMSTNLFDYIRNNTKPIFLYRDPKDSLISWFFLSNKNTPPNISNIKSFLRSSFKHFPNRLLLWKYHVLEYQQYIIDNNYLVIRYENLVQNFSETKTMVENYLNTTILLDSIPPLKQVDMSRKGIIGDHLNYFDNDTINEINSVCEKEIKFIDNYLIS